MVCVHHSCTYAYTHTVYVHNAVAPCHNRPNASQFFALSPIFPDLHNLSYLLNSPLFSPPLSVRFPFQWYFQSNVN